MSFQLVISRSTVPLFLAALLVFCILRVLLNELNWEEREREREMVAGAESSLSLRRCGTFFNFQWR